MPLFWDATAFFGGPSPGHGDYYIQMVLQQDSKPEHVTAKGGTVQKRTVMQELFEQLRSEDSRELIDYDGKKYRRLSFDEYRRLEKG